jgi:MFS family permease
METLLMVENSPRTRLLYVLFAAQSLFSAGQIAVFTLTAIVAARLSGTESLAGLPSSSTTFAQAFAALPLALLMGRFGRRYGLTLGYICGMVGGLAGVLAITQGAFPLLIVSAVLIGIGRAGSDQGRFAAGEMFPVQERGRMIGRLVFASTIGAIAGPLLASPSARLMESVGLNKDTGVWVTMLVFGGLAALIIGVLLRPDPTHVARIIAAAEEKTDDDQTAVSARPLRQLLSLPNVQLAILAMLISQTVMVILMVMTPLHMDHMHEGQDAISMVISMHTLGMFGFSALTGYLIDRFGRIPMLVVGGLTLIASALLAPIAEGQYMLGAALFLLGLGWNFGYVGGSSLLADALAGAERTRVQGINDSLVFLVAGFGSLSSGPLYAAGGFFAISMGGLALTLLLLVLIYWLTRPQMNPRVV